MMLPDTPEEAEVRGTPVGRRAAIGLLGLTVAGVLAGASVQDRLQRLLQPLSVNDPTGLTGLVPAAGGFRIYSVTGDLPKRARADWSLRVDGLVARPLQLSFSDLEDRRQTRLVQDFQCVTGWRVPDVKWWGVALATLLDEAKPTGAAKALKLWSFDGVYTESLTLSQARRPDMVVATAMQGKPITSAHGGPVRLYAGGMYGYKSIKWLERIEVVDAVEPGYWEVRGYDVDAWVGRSNGRSDEPV